MPKGSFVGIDLYCTASRVFRESGIRESARAWRTAVATSQTKVFMLGGERSRLRERRFGVYKVLRVVNNSYKERTRRTASSFFAC